MRFSLQTLILATVLLALALAAFGAFGIAIVVVLVLAEGIGRQQKSKREAIGFAVLVAIEGSVLILLLLPALTTGPGGSGGHRRSECRNNLKQLSLALLNYREAHGCFPPAYIPDKNGKPMHSWRALILPYVGCDRIYHQYNFDEAWNGPNNRKLATRVPSGVFICPNSETAPANLRTTNYLAVIGPNTAWPGAKSFCLDGVHGNADTILLVEVADSDVNWMEPRDLSLEEALASTDSDSGLAVRGSHPGTNVAMLDGSVHSLPEEIEVGELENLLRTDRDGTVPRPEPGPAKPIWPRIAAALTFLVVFILYVLRRNKDAAAFAARDRANANPAGPPDPL